MPGAVTEMTQARDQTGGPRPDAPATTMSQLPPDDSRVTVVVATRDRRPELLRSLAHHRPPVVVVDNGSSDGSAAAVRQQFPWVQVVELGHNAGAPARTVGAARARTPYVAFADDDSWWAPGALDRAVDVLDAHPRLAVLAARVLVGADERLDPICPAMAASPLGADADLPGPSVLGFLACAAVVRRDAFLAVGGFDDVVFFGGEEERVALDLARAGWGLAYVDEVVAHHVPSAVRDPSARAALAARNAVLTACLRRPWPSVARTVADTWRSGPAGRAGLSAAVARLPRALRARQVVPARVERARRLLDVPARPAPADRRARPAPAAAGLPDPAPAPGG